MIKKIFSFFVIYLLIGSFVSIDVKAQETEIDWDDEKLVEETLKQNPSSAIEQNPEKAKEFIRKHPNLVLDNENIGNAYFNSLGTIADSRDRDLAQKFLSKNTQKIFDLSKGSLQIKDGNIVDGQGKVFVVEEIKAMVDVVKVESLEGGGLRFHFKKNVVDVLGAGSIGQKNGNLVVDGKEISLPEEGQGLKIKSNDDGLFIECQSESCNFVRNNLNVNLRKGGSYEEIGDLITIKNAVVSSGKDKLYGNAEFFVNKQGIDKTRPVSLIGEISSALLDGQRHRATPKGLKPGDEFTNLLRDSVNNNEEFVNTIVDTDSFSITKICLQCGVSLKEDFDRALDSREINGYVFGLTNAISNKRVMINKGEVISKYDNAVIIGAHTSSEFITNINENNIIVDGPHSKEKNVYLGSVISNFGKLDHFNENGKTVTKQDRRYIFGNVPTTRFFFPEAVNKDTRDLIKIRDFIIAARVLPSSFSGEVAVNRLLGNKNIALIKEQNTELGEAYENLAALLNADKEPKQVANLNDAFIKDQRVTNLYLLKANGEVKLSQSGENHELFKVIAREQGKTDYLFYLAKNPDLLSDPQAFIQLQRIVQFKIWKNIQMHRDAARYEKLTNVWGYIPLSEYNLFTEAGKLLESGTSFFTGDLTEDEILFNSIVENDKAQEGAQIISKEISQGLTLVEIRNKFPIGSNQEIDSVFNDPGIRARWEIEILNDIILGADFIVNPYEELRQGKIRILRNTVDAYKKQDEPEQAKIFSLELIREKYGQDFLLKFVNQRGELCDPRTTCGGLLKTFDSREITSEQLRTIKNKFNLEGFVVQYPEEWSPEQAADILELYDINHGIEIDENRQKLREFVESFGEVKGVVLGFGIAYATGGIGLISQATAQAVRVASTPAGKLFSALIRFPLFIEESILGFSSLGLSTGIIGFSGPTGVNLIKGIGKRYTADNLQQVLKIEGIENLDSVTIGNIVESLGKGDLNIKDIPYLIENIGAFKRADGSLDFDLFRNIIETDRGSIIGGGIYREIPPGNIPLSIEEGTLERIISQERLDSVVRVSECSRNPLCSDPLDFDISLVILNTRDGKIKYYEDVAKYYETELGFSPNSLSAHPPQAPPTATDVVILEAEQRPVVAVKTYLKPGSTEPFREVEALELLRNKGVNVPEVVDLSYVNYPGISDKVVMLTTTIAPGKNFEILLKEVPKSLGPKRTAALSNLEFQLRETGKEFATFHTILPESKLTSPITQRLDTEQLLTIGDIDLNTKGMKDVLKELSRRGDIDDNSYDIFLKSIDKLGDEIGSSPIRKTVNHNDVNKHLRNIHVDEDSTVAFLDVETSLLSVSDNKAIANPGADLGGFINQLYSHAASNGIKRSEAIRLENTLLESYSSRAGIPIDKLKQNVKFFKAKYALIDMLESKESGERIEAFYRVRESLYAPEFY